MKIDIRPSVQRRIAVTFSLRQAWEILRMPQEELSQWLLNEIERNPLLELEEPALRASGKDLDRVEAPHTLYEHLMSQIREHFSDSEDRFHALALLEQLDERGYLPPTIENSRILSSLQQFDPPGLFARTLQECLLLQLNRSSIAHEVIHSHFHDLLHGRFEKIRKKMALLSLAPVIQTISRLHTRPADLFRRETAAPSAIADLSIVKIGKTWIVETKEEGLPKIRLRSAYLSLPSISAEERRALRYWAASARWLLRSLKRRRLLLLNIGTFLVRQQAAYLDGAGSLQPLTLKELSEHLHLHESTLSRAMSGKLALTPRGQLLLSSLLSMSPDADLAKRVLQRLIRQENPQCPMSDSELASHLKKIGLTVARRTVAKYRRTLKIPSATLRKHLARPYCRAPSGLVNPGYAKAPRKFSHCLNSQHLPAPGIISSGESL